MQFSQLRTPQETTTNPRQPLLNSECAVFQASDTKKASKITIFSRCWTKVHAGLGKRQVPADIHRQPMLDFELRLPKKTKHQSSSASAGQRKSAWEKSSVKSQMPSPATARLEQLLFERPRYQGSQPVSPRQPLLDKSRCWQRGQDTKKRTNSEP
jgi:hypothetical protein